IVWRIDQPNIKQRMTEYKQITFQPGDVVVIEAGGCCQTGGVGKTWKRYVDPQGPDAERLYHGLIWIPGATNGLVRLRMLGKVSRGVVVSIPLTIPKNVPAKQLYLRLGYEDDGYGDNGYWGREDGTGDQCKGLPNAYVIVRIKRGSAATPSIAHKDL